MRHYFLVRRRPSGYAQDVYIPPQSFDSLEAAKHYAQTSDDNRAHPGGIWQVFRLGDTIIELVGTGHNTGWEWK